MKKNVSLLRKMGEKMATTTALSACYPLWGFQPTPPTKLIKKAPKK